MMSNREAPKAPTSYAEQQYLAFQRETEVPVTTDNIRIIATAILKARMEKIQRPPYGCRETMEIVDEVFLISSELERREKEETAKRKAKV